MREVFDTALVLVDINEFFNKVKSIEKTVNLPAPDEIEIIPTENMIYFEWYKTKEPSYLDVLRLEFNGTTKVKLIANYESLSIDINQSLPLDEDFPELILTHLRQFKRPTKKKRYK
ncbi:MAG: hypothetical protein PHY47_01320 [Lachnospiraceae bacterium]|nr:hypothetical protein [Lachnospiraceae bacterium]